MKRINLLPEHLQRDAERKKSWTSPRMVSAGAIVLVVAWAGVALAQIAGLNSQIAAAERDIAPLREQGRALDDLLKEHHRLSTQITTLTSLREPVPTNAILSLIAKVAPEEAALRSLLIEVPSPLVASTTAPRSNRHQKPAGPAPVRIHLEGLASADVVTAAFVGRLAETGVFRNVRIDASRETVFKERRCQQFMISMDIPLSGPAASPRLAEVTTP